MTPDAKPNGNGNNSSSVGVSRQQSKRSASYPGYSLRQAEELAKAAFDLGARNCNQDKVAQAAKYSASGGAFKVLRAAAKQFGLIQVEKNGDLSVTDDWINVFHHSDDLQLTKEARRTAVLQPKLYKQIVEEFAGRQLPSVDKLARELHLNQKYGILKDAAGTAARLFLESANYAGLLTQNGYLVDFNQTEQEEVDKSVEVEHDHSDLVPPGQNVEQPRHEISKKTDQTPASQISSFVGSIPSSLEGLDRHEITLTNGKKAYLYVPVPLPRGEKERLKKYLSFISDLILEESSLPDSKQQLTESLKNDPWDD